jgi:membrane protein
VTTRSGSDEPTPLEGAESDGGDPPAKGSWRRRYERSVLREFVDALGAVEFGDRIIVFGAAMLLSVLPLIILLNALASRRVDDDIVDHLGLDARAAKLVEGLFRPSTVAFNLGVFVSLLLALAGTIAVARSVQVIYERSFGTPPAKGVANLVRCLVWVGAVAALFVADGTIGRPLGKAPAGPLLLGVVYFVVLTAFFWWSTHFLLGGREPWRRVWRVAVATGLFWTGLGVFASVYFSSTLVSDSSLYGTIGVVFTLVTWFVAMGAVVTLGAVAGVLWQRHHERSLNESPG